MNNMNTTQRVTISLPQYLYERLASLIPNRQLSSFITQALEEKVLGMVMKKKENPYEEFLQLRDKLPKISREQIIKSIDAGRLWKFVF